MKETFVKVNDMDKNSIKVEGWTTLQRYYMWVSAGQTTQGKGVFLYPNHKDRIVDILDLQQLRKMG